MSKRKPLVDFNTWSRATLANTTGGSIVQEKAVLHGTEDMPKLRKRTGKRGSGASASKKIRVVKGRVRLRVQGATQSIAPVHLIRHIPVVRIRLAAQKYLNLNKRAGKKRSKGRKKKTNKKRKSRRRRR
jgi:hypothetical protein